MKSDVDSNFEIDAFQPILEAVESRLKVSGNKENLSSLNAISDHLRAVVFCMMDGVIPSNEGRGYVVRKLIRRSLWRAYQVVPGKKLKEPFLYGVLPAVVSVMQKPYPELVDSQKSIEMTLRGEEQRFLDTLETGMEILETRLKKTKSRDKKTLSGEDIRTNCTLIFSPSQALLAAKAGASYVSPFVGRLDDISEDGMLMVEQIVQMYDNYAFEPEIIVASIRHPMHFVRSALIGADIATVPLKVIEQLSKHPLTDKGIESFLKDWEKVPK